MKRRTLSIVGAIVAAIGLIPWGSPSAEAVTVGAGTGIVLEVVDTPGGGPRTNVDESFSTILNIGTYRADSFNFQAGQAGSVTPFVAIPTGADSYAAVALGAERVAQPGLNSVPFGGSRYFTVTSNNTAVHAGITNPPGSDNPVFLDNNTVGTTTDHDGTPDVLTRPGQAVTALSNPNLPRTYAFDIEFEQVTLQRVGAGVGIIHETVDTPGAQPRTNVDETFTLQLQPGIYVVRDWEYAWGQTGVVTPFAAVPTGADAYQSVAVGEQRALNGVGVDTSDFGFSNTFVITSPTTLHGGITTPNGQNPIFLDNNTIGTSTDHDTSPGAVTVGGAVNGISNPNLPRTYAFALNVDSRPALRVGPDIAVVHEALDTPGGGPRLNVDESFSITLDPGTYRAADFSFSSGRAGAVTPFLAVLNGSAYEIIALGDTVNTPDGDVNHTVGFGGDDIFTLMDPTTIFAGITNPAGSDNPIYTDLNAGFFTDHDGTPVGLTGVGQSLPFADFSNLNLNRSYAFSIGVEELGVPEPSSLLLLPLAGAALLRRRRAA